MPPDARVAPAVLVCGEALVGVFDGAPDRPIPGGSPFNVEIGLARLGCPAAFLGGISTDDRGTLLIDSLADAGVDTRYATTAASITCSRQGADPRRHALGRLPLTAPGVTRSG